MCFVDVGCNGKVTPPNLRMKRPSVLYSSFIDTVMIDVGQLYDALRRFDKSHLRLLVRTGSPRTSG